MIQPFSRVFLKRRDVLAVIAALMVAFAHPSRVSATPPATASFVGQDTATQGNWKGVYGADGWNVIGDTSGNNPSYPGYATVTPGPHNSGVWSSTSLSAGALQSTATGSTNRAAGVWYQTSWSINVTVTGGPHLIALYLLDINSHGYGETVTISDANSHAILDTRSASNFNNGAYLEWNVSGNVSITFTATAAHWAVLSGIFFGGSGSTAPAAPTGLTAAAGSKQIALTWTAGAGATSYNVYRGTASGAESTTPIATGITGTSYTNTGLSNGCAYYYQVVGVNAVGGSIPSSEASATTATAVVSFVRADTSTSGNWKGHYGGDGWFVFGDTGGNNPHYPTYAAFAPGPHYSGLWSTSTTAPAALQVVDNASTNRVAGVAYRQSFWLNANVTGWHQMALYLYDYGNSGYAETITITDAVTGAVLDTQSASSFAGGVYYGWDVQGNVIVTFTSTSSNWAVLSGIFFGSASEIQVPDVPTNLAATPSSGQVALTWNAANRAVTYNVYRGPLSGHESPTAIASGLGTPAYTDTGVSNGAAYYYVVKAVNASGFSSVSNEVRSVVPLDTPANLAATASSQQVSLTWDATTGATSYNVYRGTASGGESGTPIATGVSSPTYTDTGRTNGTTYYYTVKAVASATTSAASTEASATPVILADGLYFFVGYHNYYLNDPGGGGAGTQVNQTNFNGADQQWTVTRVSGNQYKITIEGGVALTGPTPEQQLTLATYTGASNQLWTFSINDAGNSYYNITNVGTGENIDDWGGNTSIVGQWDYDVNEINQKWRINAVTTQAPNTITDLAATYSAGQASLTWTASDRTSSYFVYRGSSPGGEDGTPIGSGIVTNSFTDTNFGSGTYYYTVKAIGNGGLSDASNEAMASSVPAPSTVLTAAINTQVALAWSSVGGAASYRIYRGTTSGGESGTALATGLTGLQYIDTSVSNGTTYYYTVKAVDGSSNIGLASTEVNATPTALTAYNIQGIDNPSTTCSNDGMDTYGYTYNASLLGTCVVWNGQLFTWPAPNTYNCWSNTTVNFTGSGSNLYVLAAGVNGDYSSQPFVVTYTDNSTSTFYQSLSDWGFSEAFTGESEAVTMINRLYPDGETYDAPYYIYGYAFPLSAGKSVKSVQLPVNSSIVVVGLGIH